MDTKELMKQVYQDGRGFNIYELVNRFKKEMTYEMPDNVIEIVCNNYFKYKPKIRNEWAYLAKVLKIERDKAYVNSQLTKEKEFKKSSNPTLLKDIFAKKEG